MAAPKHPDVKHPEPTKLSSAPSHSARDAAKSAAEDSEVKVNIPQGAPAVPDPTVGPAHSPKMVDLPPGELKPGEQGSVKLDEKGAPIGEPHHPDPSDNSPSATVRREAAAPDQDIRTPSGAPVTDQMNPDHQIGKMDDAFLARNPPGEPHNSDAAVSADGPSKGYQPDYKNPPTAESPVSADTSKGSSKK